MRILYCSITYPPNMNGQAIFTHNLVQGMAASGHEVMVLTPATSEEKDVEEKQGIKIIRVRSIHLTQVHQDLYIPIFSKSLIRNLFDQFQPDLIHAQDPSPVNQAVIREARRRDIPVIITHHPGPEITAPYIHVRNPLLKPVFHWIVWKLLLAYLNQGDLVVVPSQFSAQMLNNHGIQANIHVVGCGVALENFRPNPAINHCAIRRQYNLDTDKTLFLFVGRIDYEKNLDTLIRAVAVSDRRDIQLAIAGQGKEIAQLQHLVEELDLHQQVVFIGSITHNKIPDLLNCSNVFVMPGCAESFSIATLEAMACAKPVLAAKSAALPELVVHDFNGYLFQPDKPDDAAFYIQQLADHSEIRERMGESSQVSALRNSIPNMVDCYEQVYQSCCRANNRRVIVKDRLPERKDSMKKPLHKTRRILTPRIIIALVVILTFLFSPIAYDQTQARSNLQITDLTQMDVLSIQGLLVIAPHPDDEILAAGGLIQRVFDNGGRVKVVFVTNGDGQFLSPLLIDPISVPRDANYINFGIIRQNETRGALGQIGVTQDETIFLGYPDGKIDELWAMDWSCDVPVRGSYTHAFASPYQNTYNIQATYCGDHLFNDLLTIFSDFQPDLILIPHPEDTHSDHASVSNFAQLAIATYQGSVDQVNPKVLSYLVHYKGYPLPRGNLPDKYLLPPLALSSDGEGWLTYFLSLSERDHKKIALEGYISQLQSSGSYLRSFIRANEIFYELPNIELPVAIYEGEELLENTIQPDFTLVQPSRERASRLVFSSADLVSWQVVRLGDLVCFGAETRGAISRHLNYRILAQLPDGSRLRISQLDDMISVTKHHFGACFNLEELGNPAAIGFSAETRSGSMLIDHTAWYFAHIPSYQ